MPTVQLPFSKGLVTSNSEGDWLDYLPVNMLAVPKEVLNSAGYMRSWPGLSQKYNTVGLARGAIFNIIDDTIYRVQGDSLVDGEGNVLATIGANGGGYAPMAFSNNTTAIVSEGKLKFWDSEEEEITELQNWEEGEYGESTITDEWALEYQTSDARYVEIDSWQPTAGLGISCEVRLTDNMTKQWIIGCRDADATTCGIFVENGEFIIKTREAVQEVLGPAVVGNNTINYTGDGTTNQEFEEPIGVIGCVANQNTPKEFLTGFVTKLILIDANPNAPADGPDSRSYTGIIPKIREENDNDPPEIIPPDFNYLEDDNNTSQVLNTLTSVNVAGGNPSVPAVSTPIALSPTIANNGIYLVSCTIETTGGNSSGFSATAGITSIATSTLDSDNIVQVFKSTATATEITLFSSNSACLFTNISVEKVSHGALVNFNPPYYSLFNEESDVIQNAATDYVLGPVIDVTRNRSRYAWLKEGSNQFGVTDLLNEQRPDYLAAFYSSELKPGDSLGIASWRGYIVVFGRHITEYFNLTGTTEPVYVNVQSLTVRCGIVGTGAKCEFLDSFCIVGSPDLESNSVYLINQGQYTEIATRKIQKVLRSYTEEELATLYMEPVKFDAHDMVIIHLPRDVLVYDYTGSAEGEQRWSILKSDITGNKVYRGIHHINSDNVWTVGDKEQNIISEFDYTKSDHVGEKVEFSLVSQMVQARNKRLFDLEVDTVSGRSLAANNMAVSLTFDGISYGLEKWIYFDSPSNYTRRILLRRMGYMRNNVAFKLRWITDTPTSISNLRVRFE